MISTHNSQLAVIWDMDGGIVDSVPLHHLAWQEAFSARGTEFNLPLANKPFGHVGTIKSILGNPSQDNITEISRYKEKTFKRLPLHRGIQPLEGILPLLARLKAEGFKQWLASVTSKETVSLIIDTLGIGPYFYEMVCAEDANAPKPSPDAFRLAFIRKRRAPAPWASGDMQLGSSQPNLPTTS
jgi:beta-phosphoglucomutase-like phosphatase (HAD superfamily)